MSAPSTLPGVDEQRTPTAGSATPSGVWQSWITFPDGSVQRSIVMYGPEGSVSESSTRYPSRLAGLGQWRPVGEGGFEAFFEKFVFEPGQREPSSWVRVQYAATLDEAGATYAGEARGIFMDLDRRVRGSTSTTVRAERLPWALPEQPAPVRTGGHDG